MAALSAGEAGSAGKVVVDAHYDEYAGEAGYSGGERANAGCGHSAGEGSHGLEALGMTEEQRG